MTNAYYFIGTKDLDGNPAIDGGIGKRRLPASSIMNYIGVPSIEEYITKVKKLGGNIIRDKTAVPGRGYLAVCVDTEDNTFGLWEEDRNAK